MTYGEQKEIPKGSRAAIVPKHRDLTQHGAKWDGEKYVIGDVIVWPNWVISCSESEWSRMILIVQEQVTEKVRLLAWADRIATMPYADQQGPGYKMLCKIGVKAEKLAAEIRKLIAEDYGD
jgi:hypothetical protein